MHEVTRSDLGPRTSGLGPRASGLGTALVLALMMVAACGPAAKPAHEPARPAKAAKATQPAPASEQHGLATWYGGKWHGRKTANGERYDKRSMTAAHRTLKFGTRVRVTNKKNGRSVVLRINNRGPYGKGRIIDVSEAAAEKLGMIDAGVVPVVVEVVR
jgi:rare lipoprotein A